MRKSGSADRRADGLSVSRYTLRFQGTAIRRCGSANSLYAGKHLSQTVVPLSGLRYPRSFGPQTDPALSRLPPCRLFERAAPAPSGVQRPLFVSSSCPFRSAARLFGDSFQGCGYARNRDKSITWSGFEPQTFRLAIMLCTLPTELPFTREGFEPSHHKSSLIPYQIW